jgi:hypothetical protein
LDKLVIKGGRKLSGEVSVSGSKNAALPVFISTLLASGASEIRNVPFLRDINTTIKVLESLGAVIEGSGHVVRIDTSGVNSHEATYDLVKTMRASVLVLGPLLARFGRARVSLPGGCAIGARPINLHLKGLAALGAEINLTHGYVEAKAKRLKGARINFDISTVGGTEQLMMAAATAKGETILENAAREPEIAELAEVLTKMGAWIGGAGTRFGGQGGGGLGRGIGGRIGLVQAQFIDHPLGQAAALDQRNLCAEAQLFGQRGLVHLHFGVEAHHLLRRAVDLQQRRAVVLRRGSHRVHHGGQGAQDGDDQNGRFVFDQGAPDGLEVDAFIGQCHGFAPGQHLRRRDTVPAQGQRAPGTGDSWIWVCVGGCHGD